jgi:hypothetical protein
VSPEGLILSAVIVMLTIAFVAWPFLKRDQAAMHLDDVAFRKERDRLLTYYTQVISSVRDLDEDLATGKVDRAIYDKERHAWTERGVAILQALDTLEGVASPIAPAGAPAGVPAGAPLAEAHHQDPSDLDAIIEAEIAAYADRAKVETL